MKNEELHSETILNRGRVGILRLVFTTALLALFAACTDGTLSDDTGSITPGTATPEGGDQPGVALTLGQPVIAISSIGATASTKATGDNIQFIQLYVDLMKADGTVTQSSSYTYTDAASGKVWTVTEGFSPLTVHGGAGNYYMRTMAKVQRADGGAMFYVCYHGTAQVQPSSASGGTPSGTPSTPSGTAATFTFNGSLTPYTSAVSVQLKDANGKVLDVNSGYRIYLRGMTQTDINNAGTDIAWTDDGNRPKYNNASSYPNSNAHAAFAGNVWTFVNIVSGTVPARWEAGGDGYLDTGSSGSPDSPAILGAEGYLFSIYKAPEDGNELDANDPGGLPTNASATYHVKPPTDSGTGQPRTYLLELGKTYTFTVTLNGKSAFITGITVADFVTAQKPEGGDDIIEIGK